MPSDLGQLCLPPGASLRQAIASLNANRRGIVLITDQERRLLGTLTDGDIRRAILAGQGLDQPLEALLEAKAASPYPQPITAPLGSRPAELLGLMTRHSVGQIPLLDSQDRVADLVVMAELMPQAQPPVRAVIMAGGFGKRLRPMTEDLPKPMLPVGGRPLMEHIVDQLKDAGIRQVHVTTHYLPEKIQEHFGDGSQFGVDLDYLCEQTPLGTAGSLGLMPTPRETLLVINGDILTRVDFAAMLAYHRQQDALITVGVRKLDLAVPYGVIKGQDGFVTSLEEKPTLSLFVNAGVYLLEPAALGHLQAGQHLDMTDLITLALAAGQPVASFPIIEYWLDIGNPADYKKANHDFGNGSVQG
ncbi:MAG: nucleotidyltransferase family protein [Desulfarculus sp.]|nr:nucleotidyltransferase family protein [Desulfarculus sp.]